MKKNNNLQGWFKANAWPIIILIMGFVATFTILQQQVVAIEKKVAEYPSQDWFDLKFQNIDDRFKALEEKLDNE